MFFRIKKINKLTKIHTMKRLKLLPLCIFFALTAQAQTAEELKERNLELRELIVKKDELINAQDRRLLSCKELEQEIKELKYYAQKREKDIEKVILNNANLRKELEELKKEKKE